MKLAPIYSQWVFNKNRNNGTFKKIFIDATEGKPNCHWPQLTVVSFIVVAVKIISSSCSRTQEANFDGNYEKNFWGRGSGSSNNVILELAIISKGGEKRCKDVAKTPPKEFKERSDTNTFRWFYLVLIPNFCAWPHSQQSHHYVLTSNWFLPSSLGAVRLPSSLVLVRSEPVMRWWSHGGAGWIGRHKGCEQIAVRAARKNHPQSYFKEMISFLGALTGSNRTQQLFVGRKLYPSNPSVFPPVGNRQTLICVIMRTDFYLDVCLEIC